MFFPEEPPVPAPTGTSLGGPVLRCIEPQLNLAAESLAFPPLELAALPTDLASRCSTTNAIPPVDPLRAQAQTALHHLVLHRQLELAALAPNALISPQWGAPTAAEFSLVLDPNVSTTTAPLVRVAWAVVAALSCPPTSAAALVEPLTLSTVRRVHAHHPHVLKT